jgi:hypothetical protein
MTTSLPKEVNCQGTLTVRVADETTAEEVNSLFRKVADGEPARTYTSSAGTTTSGDSPTASSTRPSWLGGATA